MRSKATRSVLFLLLVSFLAFLGVLVPLSVSQDSSHRTTSHITTIFVDPPSAMGVVGTNITVNLNISNAHDVFAWQIFMEWNPSVLKFIDIVQGDFLNKLKETTTEELPARTRAWITTSKMDKYIGSVLVYRLREDNFTLLVGEALLGKRPGVSGNGTLCSAIFQVVTSGSSVIKIDKVRARTSHHTMVLDSSLQEAPVTIQHGFFLETNSFDTVTFNADIVTLGFLSILLPTTLLLPAKLKSIPKKRNEKVSQTDPSQLTN